MIFLVYNMRQRHLASNRKSLFQTSKKVKKFNEINGTGKHELLHFKYWFMTRILLWFFGFWNRAELSTFNNCFRQKRQKKMAKFARSLILSKPQTKWCYRVETICSLDELLRTLIAFIQWTEITWFLGCIFRDCGTKYLIWFSCKLLRVCKKTARWCYQRLKSICF